MGLYNALNVREIHKRKVPLGRHSSWHRWNENTKTDFKEMVWPGVQDQLANDRVHRQAVVKTCMNLQAS